MIETRRPGRDGEEKLRERGRNKEVRESRRVKIYKEKVRERGRDKEMGRS